MLINKSYQQNYVYKTLLLLISDVILELNMLITVNKILFLQKEMCIRDRPILVRNINNKFYELISGERRLMAAKGAGLDKIPAIILTVSDNRSAVISLLENTQRQNLSFIEEAEGFYSLKEDYGFTEDEIDVYKRQLIP